MTPEVLAGACVAGLTGGSLQVLPALGVSLVYQQGRYVPLWLPSAGMLAAYAVHAGAPLGAPGALAGSLALVAVLAWALHRLVFRPLIDRALSLEALLAGIGLGQIAEAAASLYGDGLSQHYAGLGRGRAVATLSGLPLYLVDAVSLGLAAVFVPALVLALRRTHLGLRVRAVLAHRDLADTHRLPVEKIDAIVVVTAAALVATGAVVRAARYDLQPGLMAQPGLCLVAAIVTAGPGRHVAAVGVAVAIEVGVALAGSVPALSAFQQAIPFVVLAAALLVRARGRA